MGLDPNKIIDFYWFSGTGNTLSVIRGMKERFEQKGFTVNLKSIEKADPSLLDCAHTLGIGIPVAEQGTYPFIWNFIKNLPECTGTDVFMVDTLMMYSGGIIGPVKKILKRKGYNTVGAKEIKMPNNFFVRKNDEIKTKQIMEQGMSAARDFAEELISGSPSWRDIPLYSAFMSSFSKMNLTWNFFRKTFPLNVDHDTCTLCRLCERLCPVDNWSLNELKNNMEWSNNCVYCMRCFAHCPVNAIHYGSKKNLQYRVLKAADFL